MKTVNIENIEKRIENVTSVLKNFSLTKYMLPIQLKQLRFERDCLRKLLELMENKPVSVNAVELPMAYEITERGPAYHTFRDLELDEDGAWLRKDDVIEALRQQGYEVKMIKLPEELSPEDLREIAEYSLGIKLDDREPEIAHAIWIHCLAEVQRLNATAQPISDGWVKCSDRMPKEDQMVIVWAETPVIEYSKYAYWNESEKQWWGDDEKQIYSVTHWMPLPAPPELNVMITVDQWGLKMTNQSWLAREVDLLLNEQEADPEKSDVEVLKDLKHYVGYANELTKRDPTVREKIYFSYLQMLQSAAGIEGHFDFYKLEMKIIEMKEALK